MYNCENRNSCGCLALILAIVTGLFLVTLGLILGSVFSTFFMSVMAPLVVLAIVLFIMAAVILIYKLCVNRNN